MTSDSGTSAGGYVGMQSPDGQWTWDGAQWVPSAQQPAKKKGHPILLVVAALVVVVIGLALWSNQRRDNQANHDVDQQSHCLDLITGGTPSSQLPSYCVH